jgi:hypothetical protein
MKDESRPPLSVGCPYWRLMQCHESPLGLRLYREGSMAQGKARQATGERG